MVNDSRDQPNSKMKKGIVNGKPILSLFALKQISPSEEILYDYGCEDLWWRNVSTVFLKHAVKLYNYKNSKLYSTGIETKDPTLPSVVL